jgi:GxxExxY protein
MKTTKQELDQLTYKIIGAAIEVHKNLGAGLLESVYHRCLEHELTLRGISYSSELVVPITYKGYVLDAELRCDLVIENKIVSELKAADEIHPIYATKLLTYMRLLEKPKGILINFNCANLFHDGQWTYVNQYFKNLPDR